MANGIVRYRVEVIGSGFNVPDSAFVNAARLGGRSIAEDARTYVATYPPETEANKPGRTREVTRKTRTFTMTGPAKTLSAKAYSSYSEIKTYTVKVGWYERGAGWRYPSGKLAPKKRSQRLGTKWQVVEVKTGTGSLVNITNSATYWPYVHGEKQAGFHRKRRWRQIFRAMKNQRRKWVDAANTKVLAYLRGSQWTANVSGSVTGGIEPFKRGE